MFWEASEHIAYLLSVSPGQVWTSAALGEQLYGDQNLESSTETSRASSLLSGAATGKVKVIENKLNELGLVLQFGLAYKVDSDGRRYGRGQRVVRALDISKPHKQSDNNIGLGVDWDSMAEEQPQEVSSTIEEQGGSASGMYEDVTEDINRLIPLVISVKEGANLLVVGAKIGSRTVGTKENLRRACDAGLITKEEMRTGIVKSTDAIIMTAIYNSHKRLLSSPKHLNNIKKLIEEAIANYTEVNS